MGFWDSDKLKMWDKKGGLFIMFSHRFKILGIIISLLSAASFFLVNNYELALKDIFTSLCGNFFLLGFLIIILSKEKYEDERTSQLRLKALSFSFVMTILNILIVPLILLLFQIFMGQESLQWDGNWGSFLTILTLQLYYLICFYRLKQDL